MKKPVLLYIALFTLITCDIHARDFFTGISCGTDSIKGAIGICTDKRLSLAVEGGIAWERNADFIPDDLVFTSILRYSLAGNTRVNFYFSGSADLHIINTRYTIIYAPGFSLGYGTELRLFGTQGLFLEGGIQHSRGPIHSEYTNEHFHIQYNETWKAPNLWVNIGWRYYL